MVSAPSRRELVRRMTERGLSERRALRVIGMSASAYRYQSAPDRNVMLREQIVALAQRHRRYGSGMIYRARIHWVITAFPSQLHKRHRAHRVSPPEEFCQRGLHELSTISSPLGHNLPESLTGSWVMLGRPLTGDGCDRCYKR